MIPTGLCESNIREDIATFAQSQYGAHYLWGAEGQIPTSGGEVVLSSDYPHAAIGVHYKMKDDSLYYCAGRYQRVSLGENTSERPLCMAPPNENNPGSPVLGHWCDDIRHFDCSGLVCWVLWQVNLSISRLSSAELYNKSKPITRGQLQKGDLIFLKSVSNNRVHHVCIYIGGGCIVEARGTVYGVINERTVDDWNNLAGEEVLYGDIVSVLSSSVGGVWVPFEKLAPYIVLVSTIVVATVATAIYARLVKRRKEKR